jgi:hypothetical protein
MDKPFGRKIRRVDPSTVNWEKFDKCVDRSREIPERCARCKCRTWNLKKGEKVQIGRPKKSKEPR